LKQLAAVRGMQQLKTGQQSERGVQVGLNAQAMVTCSLMHASILRSGKEYVGEEAEAEYMQKCQWFIADYARGYCRPPPAPARTFEEHWNTRCERDWKFAFQLYSAGARPLLRAVSKVQYISSVGVQQRIP
jgi:calcium release-activated calcium channel protein 1